MKISHRGLPPRRQPGDVVGQGKSQREAHPCGHPGQQQRLPEDPPIEGMHQVAIVVQTELPQDPPVGAARGQTHRQNDDHREQTEDGGPQQAGTEQSPTPKAGTRTGRSLC